MTRQPDFVEIKRIRYNRDAIACAAVNEDGRTLEVQMIGVPDPHKHEFSSEQAAEDALDLLAPTPDR